MAVGVLLTRAANVYTHGAKYVVTVVEPANTSACEAEDYGIVPRLSPQVSPCSSKAEQLLVREKVAVSKSVVDAIYSSVAQW